MRGRIEMICRIDTEPREAQTVVTISGHLSNDALEQFRNVIRSAETDGASPFVRMLLLDDFETTRSNAPV